MVVLLGLSALKEPSGGSRRNRLRIYQLALIFPANIHGVPFLIGKRLKSTIAATRAKRLEVTAIR